MDLNLAVVAIVSVIALVVGAIVISVAYFAREKDVDKAVRSTENIAKDLTGMGMNVVRDITGASKPKEPPAAKPPPESPAVGLPKVDSFEGEGTGNDEGRGA